jgi:hypothetical protein
MLWALALDARDIPNEAIINPNSAVSQKLLLDEGNIEQEIVLW